jgi:hypothetical protein
MVVQSQRSVFWHSCMNSTVTPRRRGLETINTDYARENHRLRYAISRLRQLIEPVEPRQAPPSRGDELERAFRTPSRLSCCRHWFPETSQAPARDVIRDLYRPQWRWVFRPVKIPDQVAFATVSGNQEKCHRHHPTASSSTFSFFFASCTCHDTVFSLQPMTFDASAWLIS